MNHISLYPFISLINSKNDKLQCETCLDVIPNDSSYIVDCKDESTYCHSTCLAHSFEFNLVY